ncbi:nucleotide exchange factor GrpE [bacterium]|nr:nucleotide exchange factor GrpE [bacterium]
MEAEKLNKQNESKEIDANKIPIERAENLAGENEILQGETVLNETELKKALEKIAEVEKQNTELKDALLRKAAEFENFKRRNENDQFNIIKYAAESFIRNILPIYDDLERSLSHIDEATNFESTKKGLSLVFEKFGKILDNQGVKKIEAKGKPFDVHFHEALMQQPAEGIPPHTVLEVLEPGYMYKDRVIRHAKVIVSQEMDHSQNQPESEDKNNIENSSEQE